MKGLTRFAQFLGMPARKSRPAKTAVPPAQVKAPAVSQPDVSVHLNSTSGSAIQSAKPQGPAMKMNFEHLKSGASEDSAGYREQNESQQKTHSKDDPADVRTHIPSQHGRAHNVAVSQEAADSPVLAVQLLKDTKLSSAKIRAQLREDPESLSAFTRRFMKENAPGWEFLEDDEQASSAQQYALTNADKNGYLASKDTALRALKKMEEPLTEDEIAAVAEKTRRIMNMTNPNTPDNIAARKQADEQYQEQIAKATVARNNQLRATGLVLPGDARQADGTPVGPSDEAESVKRSLSLRSSSPVR